MNYFVKVIKLNSNTTKSRNKALSEALKTDKNYFFLVEDNCEVLDPSIYEKFIQTSQKTGIEALMWGEGGENRRLPFDKDPYIDYYADFAPAFTMYTRNAIEKVGLFDEDMPPNTWQVLEHAKRIGDKELSSPFGTFASPKDITELKLTKNKDEFKDLSQMEKGLRYWEAKDDEFPIDIKGKKKEVMKTQPITEMI
jgi:hypothetical protein